MDKITHFRTSLKNILNKHYEEDKNDFIGYDTQRIIDEVNGHYLLLRVGWDGMKRKYSALLHLDIKNDKIWIQQDYTEEGIATDLLELGIAKSDIVLAFQAPLKRPFTEFAVG